MSVNALGKGNYVKIGPARFLILQRLADDRWQLQNTATGEWCAFTEDDLLDRFTRNELTFDRITEDRHGTSNDSSGARLDRDLSHYSPELVAVAQSRVQYLKEIDRRPLAAITLKTLEPVIQFVAERINDRKPPGWRTLARDYGKWLRSGRDIRAIILRHSEKGCRGPRILPEVKAITDNVIEDLYMTAERKRVPEVHLEIVRRVADANRFRPATEHLPIPSQRTIYREIARKSPYELMVARYGKRRAEMEFRVSSNGPETSRALQRVSLDHTPSDIIVVDDSSMLPLGRPTITSALDEHTRCPMGFYMGFEPPSCLSVMRCLKHAILPKTYVSRELPSIKNPWECYGLPELVIVDNPPEFHSSHFERACLQIGTDIQYAKVLVPWYKGKLERFQGTMNHDLVHGNPGTTFSNILERDEYDPTRHAVVMLGTFREMLHKWIIDVYLQTPHRGIKDTPAHRWRSETVGLPPPLPPSATELDVVLGMTAQRVIFHYGIELEGLKYNGPELGELRRRIGTTRVELTFNPGDLWQNKVIRRYAQRRLNARTDILALAQAKAEIRELVERDFHRKSTHGRKRHARFLEDHTGKTVPAITGEPICNRNLATYASPAPDPWPQPDAFSDAEVLPVFEATLDLPRVPVEANDLSVRHQPE